MAKHECVCRMYCSIRQDRLVKPLATDLTQSQVSWICGWARTDTTHEVPDMRRHLSPLRPISSGGARCLSSGLNGGTTQGREGAAQLQEWETLAQWALIRISEK